jgi:cytochrome c556
MRTLIVAFLILVASACAPAQQATPSAAPAPAFKTTGNVTQLMTALVIPSSDILFEVGSKPPADEAGWIRVQNAAVALAESGNLLMIGDRSKPEKEWADFSRAMIDAGQLALKAADNKNVDEVLAAGDKIYETCDNCHMKYMDKTK